jgi:flagellar biosynthesis protein FlhF
MDVKEFRQPTVREAFRAIREDFGPDALVLASELVPARGWRGWIGMREVQVTAAPPAVTSARRPVVTERRSTDSDLVPRTLEQEPPSSQTRPQNHVAARLMAAGIDSTLAHAAAARVPANRQRGASLPTLRQALADEVAGLVSGVEAYASVEIFIGPPGVGKTTTIAKIAAQERARRGQLLGMVAADAFRAGAVEQLRTYAAIIGSPFRIARSSDDFARALGNGRQPVLVDTAGRSHVEAGIQDLHRLVGKRRPVRTHLVIAGDTSVKTARRILDAYQDARPDRCVVSKIDEADSLMPLLQLLQERGLPISYLTNGQRVPEDLDRATPAALAAALLCDPRTTGAAA